MARPPRSPRSSGFDRGADRPGPGRRSGPGAGPSAKGPRRRDTPDRDRDRDRDRESRRPREHERDLIRITGVPAVAAVFERDGARVERLFFDARTAGRAGPWSQVMAAARKPYRIVEDEELARIAGTQLHGGIVAVCRPRPVEPFDAARAATWAKDGRPLLILDGVGNPHNLGAIVRTLAFFGLERLVISDHPGQAGPSESAHRVAEGGMEWVTLHRAERLAGLLPALAAHYHVIGTALRDGPSPTLADLAAGSRPPAIILGNEEEGLPPATLKACESVLTLPGAGRVQSLNVAATAAIITHTLAGRR